MLHRADKPLPIPPGAVWVKDVLQAADLLARVASAVEANPSSGALEQLHRARLAYEAIRR